MQKENLKFLIIKVLVIIIADVFENFRNMSLKEYKLLTLLTFYLHQD